MQESFCDSCSCRTSGWCLVYVVLVITVNGLNDIFFSQQTGLHSSSSSPAHLLKFGNPYNSWICDICTVVLSHAIRKMIRNTPSTANKQVEHIEPDLDTTAINTR